MQNVHAGYAPARHLHEPLAIIGMDETILKSITREFRVNDLFLFGNSSSQNDIDILIVSNDFSNISRIKRKQLIQKSSPMLDPICLTDEEFNKLNNSDSSLWEKISTTGKRLI